MSLKKETQQQSNVSFECPVCFRKFSYRYRLKQHERSHHKTTNFRSNKSLKKAFSSLNRIQYSRVHQEKHLALNSHSDQPHCKQTERHLCRICDNVFISHRQLTTHILSHRKLFRSHSQQNQSSKSGQQNGQNSENNSHRKTVRNSINLLKARKARSKSFCHKKLQFGKTRRSSCKENHHKVNLVKYEKDPNKGRERKNIFESLSESSVMKLSDSFADSTTNNLVTHMESSQSQTPIQLTNGSDRALKMAIECLQSKINYKPILNGKRRDETRMRSVDSLDMPDSKRRKTSPCRTPTQNAHKRLMKKYHKHRLHKSKYAKTDSRKIVSLQTSMSNNSFETEFLKTIQQVQPSNGENSRESMDIPNLQHYQSGPIIDKSNKTMPDLCSPEIDNSDEYSNNLSIDPIEKCDKSDKCNRDLQSDLELIVDSNPEKNSTDDFLWDLKNKGILEQSESLAAKSDTESAMLSENEKNAVTAGMFDVTNDLSDSPLNCLNYEPSTECHPYREVEKETNSVANSSAKLLSPVKWQQQFLSFINSVTNNVSTPSSRQNRQKKRSRATRSSVCSCCILSATPGKKKRHGHHKVGRPKRVSHLSYILPQDHEEFTKDTTCLLTLRQKVYRLLCTLFPRCLMVLQFIDPESEKVEILIDEIIGNLDDKDCSSTGKSPKESSEMNNNNAQNCHSADSITKSENHISDSVTETTSENTIEQGIVDYSLSVPGANNQCIPSPEGRFHLKEDYCVSPSTKTKEDIDCCDELDDAVIDRNPNSNIYSETSDYFSEQNSTSPDYENLSQNSGSPGTEVICRDYKETFDNHKLNRYFLKEGDKSFVKKESEDIKEDGEQLDQSVFDDVDVTCIDDEMIIIEDRYDRADHKNVLHSGATNHMLTEEAITEREAIDDDHQNNLSETQNVSIKEKGNVDLETLSGDCNVAKDISQKEHTVSSEKIDLLGSTPLNLAEDSVVCEKTSSIMLQSHSTTNTNKELNFHFKPQITLCKKPKFCLMSLKTKILALLRSLLPELPIEKYSSSDNLGYLLDVLNNANGKSD